MKRIQLKPIWFKLNSICLNSTKFNSIEISLRTLPMMNPKKKEYCV